MGWCWNGSSWGGWGSMSGIGLILNLVLFAGVLAVLGLGSTWLLRQIRRPAAVQAEGGLLEIVRRRLAAGEITIAEFEEIRDRLQS